MAAAVPKSAWLLRHDACIEYTALLLATAGCYHPSVMILFKTCRSRLRCLGCGLLFEEGLDVAGYMGFIFFSTVLPGPPVWQTPPEVLKEVLNESIGVQTSESACCSLLSMHECRSLSACRNLIR